MTNVRKVAISIIFMVVSCDAFSYMGPGGGLTAIGVLIALVGFIFFTALGFVWYPINTFYKKIRKQSLTPNNTDEMQLKDAEDEGAREQAKNDSV